MSQKSLNHCPNEDLHLPPLCNSATQKCPLCQNKEDGASVPCFVHSGWTFIIFQLRADEQLCKVIKLRESLHRTVYNAQMKVIQ